MATAEARYVEWVGDHIIEIMPKNRRRQRLVLRYVRRRLCRASDRAGGMAYAASVAVLAAAAILVLDGVAASPTVAETRAARIIQKPDGTLVLAVTRQFQGVPDVLVHREILSREAVDQIMATPDWERAILAHHGL